MILPFYFRCPRLRCHTGSAATADENTSSTTRQTSPGYHGLSYHPWCAWNPTWQMRITWCVLLWCRRCRILSISSFWPTASLSLFRLSWHLAPPVSFGVLLTSFHHTHTLLPYLLLPILKFKTWKREPVQSPLSGYDAIGDVRTTNRILVAHIFQMKNAKKT